MAREWGLDLAEPGTEVTQDECSNCAAIYFPIYVLSESVTVGLTQDRDQLPYNYAKSLV